MSTVVFGANPISLALSKKLKRDAGDVLVMAGSDDDLSPFEEIGIDIFRGNCCDPSTITTMCNIDATTAIALQENDAENIVACGLMSDLFSTRAKIARVQNVSYLPGYGVFLRGKTGLLSSVDSLISMEECSTSRISEALLFPRGVDIRLILGGRVAIMGILIEEIIISVAIEPLRELGCCLIGALRGRSFLSIEEAGTLEPQDVLYIGCDPRVLDGAYAVLHRSSVELRHGKLVVVGGGKMGSSIVHHFQRGGNKFSKIVVIEKNQNTAEVLAEKYPNITVVCGDVINETVMFEAGVNNADLLIGAARDDSINIMSCYMGKKLGCPNTASLVTETAYAGLFRGMGVDIVISPTDAMIEKIIASMPKSLDVKLFADSTCALLQTTITEDRAGLEGKTISDVESKYGVMVVAIGQGGSVSIAPSKKYKLERGDSIAIWSLYRDIGEIKAIIKG